MVGHRPLEAGIIVRIYVPEPKNSPPVNAGMTGRLAVDHLHRTADDGWLESLPPPFPCG